MMMIAYELRNNSRPLPAINIWAAGNAVFMKINLNYHYAMDRLETVDFFSGECRGNSRH